MVTDPIADMLTRIRNAGVARHERVDIPFSNLKEKVAGILKEEGFIGDFRVIKGKSPGHSQIELKLKYDENREPVIVGLKRISRPGLRQYRGYQDIPKIRQGLGVVIVSTPQGLMTDRKARATKVGGELLCSVW